MTPKMHADEIDIDEGLVRQLLEAQFPAWEALPLRAVPTSGTDHAIYRLGEDMAVRLPRIEWAAGQAHKEMEWLPRLASQLPLEIPEVLAIGHPAAGYPLPWSISRWLPGENLPADRISDPIDTAHRLADFLLDLQQIDPTGGPPAAQANVRGLPPVHRDADTRRAIAALADMYDADRLTAIWETALGVDDWDQDPVWIHGDMLPGNLLFDNGQLSGVIDFGGLAVGDPACDLMIAWGLFRRQAREAFRTALGVDDATWRRGRGHALAQAVIFIPYYLDTNLRGVGYARQALEAIMQEPAA